MFFQLIIAILLGFSAPKQTTPTNHNDTVVTTNSFDEDTPDDGSGSGGQGGQIDPPR